MKPEQGGASGAGTRIIAFLARFPPRRATTRVIPDVGQAASDPSGMQRTLHPSEEEGLPLADIDTVIETGVWTFDGSRGVGAAKRTLRESVG